MKYCLPKLQGLLPFDRSQVPADIIAVIGSIIAGWALNLGKYGVPLLGGIPQGLPRFGLPDIAWNLELMKSLLPIAFSMFVLILTQSAVTSRAYAFRNEEIIMWKRTEKRYLQVSLFLLCCW